MLYDGPSTQSILDDDLRKALPGKTWINTSSVSVEFSHFLDRYVRDAGGIFVEMPVSGSKGPAEKGRLVGMIAGDRDVAENIQSLMEPITAAAVYCGPIGSGLKTKYATNILLVTVTMGLAECMKLARSQDLDIQAVGQVLDAGQLASVYSKTKVAKILAQDWSPQAAVKDCYNNTRLILSAAEEVNAQVPLARMAEALYKQAIESGLGEEDMIAIAKPA
jgi:3-hydroxyisobutyrate dehydrogenase